MPSDEIASEGAKAVLGEVLQAAKDDPNMKKAGSNLARSAATVTQAVNTVLLPLAALNYSVERAKQYFQTKFGDDLAKKLEGVDESDIVEPKASIAGPALQGLAFTHDEPLLKDMFLNLISGSMNAAASGLAHPSFVEIIKQMDATDAKIFAELFGDRSVLTLQRPIIKIRINTDSGGHKNLLTRFSQNMINEDDLTYLKRMEMSIENFQRMGIIDIDFDVFFQENDEYTKLENSKFIKFCLEHTDDIPNYESLESKKGTMRLSTIGTQFRDIVLPKL